MREADPVDEIVQSYLQGMGFVRADIESAMLAMQSNETDVVMEYLLNNPGGDGNDFPSDPDPIGTGTPPRGSDPIQSMSEEGSLSTFQNQVQSPGQGLEQDSMEALMDAINMVQRENAMGRELEREREGEGEWPNEHGENLVPGNNSSVLDGSISHSNGLVGTTQTQSSIDENILEQSVRNDDVAGVLDTVLNTLTQMDRVGTVDTATPVSIVSVVDLSVGGGGDRVVGGGEGVVEEGLVHRIEAVVAAATAAMATDNSTLTATDLGPGTSAVEVAEMRRDLGALITELSRLCVEEGVSVQGLESGGSVQGLESEDSLDQMPDLVPLNATTSISTGIPVTTSATTSSSANATVTSSSSDSGLIPSLGPGSVSAAVLMLQSVEEDSPLLNSSNSLVNQTTEGNGNGSLSPTISFPPRPDGPLSALGENYSGENYSEIENDLPFSSPTSDSVFGVDGTRARLLLQSIGRRGLLESASGEGSSILLPPPPGVLDNDSQVCIFFCTL